jgi:hypothetical protein
MHVPHPSLASGPSTRQRERSADRSAVTPWPTERRLLEILDVVLIAFLLAPFLLA